MKRILLVPAVGIALLGLGSSAHAQSSWGVNSRPQYEERQSYYDSRQAAYQNGFREGAKQGEKDGRKGNAFAYQDERTFQRADKGYSRSYGDVERYRQKCQEAGIIDIFAKPIDHEALVTAIRPHLKQGPAKEKPPPIFNAKKRILFVDDESDWRRMAIGHLNERGYIVPGLGDAGDRQFGTG